MIQKHAILNPRDQTGFTRLDRLPALRQVLHLTLLNLIFIVILFTNSVKVFFYSTSSTSIEQFTAKNKQINVFLYIVVLVYSSKLNPHAVTF